MALPREDVWRRRPYFPRLPARGIHPEKQVEGAIATHASQHGEGGSDALSPGAIGAAGAAHDHGLLKHILNATRAPTVNDDETAGYSVGSHWYDISSKKAYLCLDAAEGAAVWRDVTHHATSSDDVTTPTDAELDSAFGTPAEVGDGFIGILDDNGAGTTVYLCVAMNGAWWYEALTKAT